MRIKLTAEDYKVFCSAMGALQIAEDIANDDDVEPALKTCADVFIAHMSQTLDDSVFSLFHMQDKDEAGPMIAQAWTDIEREVAIRRIVTRLKVDGDEQ